MTSKFSSFHCSFRKNRFSKYSLLKIMETWKKRPDQEDQIGVILMDLSKAFDTTNHSLLLAKSEAYGFSTNSLNLIQNYLCNRCQRTKVNGSFSDWTEILELISEGSILGPLLFKILLNDIFLLFRN